MVLIACATATALLAVARAEAQTPRPVDDLADLWRIDARAAGLIERAPACGAAQDGALPPENLQAEAELERAAGLLAVIVLEYPRPVGAETEQQQSERIAGLEDKLIATVEVHRRAYRCNPGRAGERHLQAALALIAAFERMLREQEKLADGAPSLATTTRLTTAVQEELPGPQACPPERVCPLPPPPPVPAPPEGYVGKARGRIFLRTELGLGWGHIEYPILEPTYDGHHAREDIDTRVFGPVLRVGTGVRLLAGERDRHAVLLGGFYSFQHVTNVRDVEGLRLKEEVPSVYRFTHAGGLAIEWGIRLRDGAVSIHPGLEFGVLAFLGDDTFGHLRYGGSLGLCFVGEVVCLTGRMHGAAQSTQQRKSWGPQLTVGFDLFRIIDRRLARRSE